MNPNKILILILSLIISLSGLNCTKDEPTESESTDFTGTWTASMTTAGTKMEYDASEINENFKTDFLDFGASFTIAIQGLRYSLLWVIDPTNDPTADTGSLVIKDKKFTLTSDDAEEDILSFDYTRDDTSDGSFVTLKTSGVYYPGTEIPAKLTIIMKKIE
jgi:hypothetical protein